MKNINILLKSFLIFIICITSVTCSLSIDEISKDQSNQNEMVLVRFGVFDLPSRSVMPVMPTAADISYFYLYGISSADTVTDQVRLGLFSDNLSDANVLLKPGTWNFTLIAYNDYDIPILSGVRNNIIITTGYTGTVNFNLETISVSSYEGIVSIILELPFDVTIASVETVIDSVILTPPLSVADRAIQFNDTMPAGDYLINFFLKDSESRALAVITEIVVVRSGLLSSKLITLTKDDFNSPPAAPSNFKIVSYIDGFLTFNWVRNSLNETGFILSNGTSNFALSIGSTSHVLFDLIPLGKTFTINAFNEFGESSKAEFLARVPDIPIGLSAVPVSATSIQISWQAVNTAESYTIQRSLSSEGPFTFVDITADTSYINTGLTFSTTYHYRVLANNMFGNSEVSVIASTQTVSLFGIHGDPLPLVVNEWTNGNIAAAGAVQWYEFTATEGMNYFHLEFNSLNDLYAQIYDNTGAIVGNEERLYGATTNFSRLLTTGQQYYIRVRPFSASGSGTYLVFLNNSESRPVILPVTGVTTLAADTWANGNITAAGGFQWFRFTATEMTQYIHAGFGTLNDLYIQVYNSTGYTIGNETRISSATTNLVRQLVVGHEYFIRVRSYAANGSGTYQIIYNNSVSPPIVLPTTGVIILAENNWSNGNITSISGQQWFRYAATAVSQHIHVEFNTLNDIFAQVYDKSGYAVGSEVRLSGNTTNFFRTLTAEEEYFIRVRPYSVGGSGTYQITFNKTIMPPGAQVLIENTWADSSINAPNGIRWFMFTATAAAQYIHTEFGTLNDIYIQLYDSNGNTVESEVRFSGNNRNISRLVTAGHQYFIRVRSFSASGIGTFKIGFTSAIAPPGTTALSLDTWVFSNLAPNGEQWFSFIATSDKVQYIHILYDDLRSVTINLFNNNSIQMGNQLTHSGGTTGAYIASTAMSGDDVIAGNVYYVRIAPASGSGTYRMAHNSSVIPPGITPKQLTVNSWVNGGVNTNGQDYIRFTATAEIQFIHIIPGSLTNMLFSFYDNDGYLIIDSTVGSSGGISAVNLDIGKQYIICIRPSQNNTSGNFQIGLTTSFVPPGITAIEIAANTWNDGNIAVAGGVQWFSYYTSEISEYLHVKVGTLTAITIRMYHNSTYLGWINSTSNNNTILPLINGAGQYYFQIEATSPGSRGNYQINPTDSFVPPDIPVTALMANTWTSGNVAASGNMQWFSFTANAATQFIHVNFGTLNDMYIQVIDSSANMIGSEVNLFNTTRSINRSLIPGNKYYVRIRPFSSNTGTFQITFNSSAAPP